MEEVKFGAGILFHDVTVLATLKNCLFNTDTQVLLELYILAKKSEKIQKRFPTLINFIEGMDNDSKKICTAVQNKTDVNPLVDFFDWSIEMPDVFGYLNALYNRLYYQELDTLKVDPIPTLLGNLLSISIRLDDFHKLYILDESHPQHMKTYMQSFFKRSNKVELLEGTLEEAVEELTDVNFVILENSDDVSYFMTPHKKQIEILIPGFRSNLLNADELEEFPPILSLPEGADNYKGDFNLSIKAIGIPI